jgi:imidazolonepropionase-like amidohydrolase
MFMPGSMGDTLRLRLPAACRLWPSPGELTPVTAASRPILLRDATVFDSEARSFTRGLDVLLRDGRIAQIGPGLQAGPGVPTVECAGLWLLPGLIDCHVHLTSGGGANELAELATEPRAIRTWKTARHAGQTLQAGVTTVRDLGAGEQLNVQLANAVDSGLVEGPEILAAGMAVTMTGGHGHGFIGREADGPDDVRKAVREQLRAGARAIKLIASGGVMTPGVDPRSPSFTEEELTAGVEEAHKAFRVVGAHAQATAGIKNAIRAGVDSIEHGVWLDDEAVQMMAERGTRLVPTLTAPHHIATGGIEAGIPRYAVEKAQQVQEDHVRSYELALRTGVRLAMGTNEGTPLNRPGENAQEVVLMAKHGLSSAAAILAATAWAAELLCLHEDRGRIAEGLRADLIGVRGDPVEDIGILARPGCVSLVIKDGRVVRSNSDRRPGGLS